MKQEQIKSPVRFRKTGFRGTHGTSPQDRVRRVMFLIPNSVVGKYFFYHKHATRRLTLFRTISFHNIRSRDAWEAGYLLLQICSSQPARGSMSVFQWDARIGVGSSAETAWPLRNPKTRRKPVICPMYLINVYMHAVKNLSDVHRDDALYTWYSPIFYIILKIVNGYTCLGVKNFSWEPGAIVPMINQELIGQDKSSHYH